MQTKHFSPFALSNVRRFIAFRVFFNSRFYYPVFTILFLDYGLTIEQFAILNTVWAFTIVCAEVPSGALADLIGRKQLLVTTSILMIAEMTLLAFVPLGNSTLIFSAFLINRILSGLAEALASGADEAMAYDTLVAKGDPEDWPKVLDIQMRIQNFSYMITMTIGAMIYDPGTVNSVLNWFGLQMELSQQVTMRFPVYLTLGLGILSLVTTLGMQDPVLDKSNTSEVNGVWQKITEASRITMMSGRWILKTPMALTVILLGMSLDHCMRMLVTMTSQYYRIIELPEASFGLIGSGIAMIGLVVPRLARAMVDHYKPITNVCSVIALAITSLWGLTFFIKISGILPMAMIFVTMMLTSFFTSHYLNKITDPGQRATVLSYKGLAFNAAYGVIGILFAGLIAQLRLTIEDTSPTLTTALVENEAFRQSIGYFPWYLSFILLVITIICVFHFHLQTPEK
ncbi:MFS transporter [Desulfotalea psychrophila]|nr:MFS transporter [Desulfocapsa sp.]MBN4071667.1 MFS transporter [Desulfotalea psychrophila]